MNSKLFFRTILLFMVCFVSFSVDARIVKTHKVVAENASGQKLKSAITGATKKHRFADIDVEAQWEVIDHNICNVVLNPNLRVKM